MAHVPSRKLAIQFVSEPASVLALVGVAERFGGVIEAGTATSSATGEPFRWCSVQFPYDDVRVDMSVHLPVTAE